LRAKVFLSAAIACAALLLPSAAIASNPVVYQANDTTPDTVGAPDIGSVTISDTTNGLIAFQVSLVPGSEQIAQDSVSIYIDSDQNPTTGDTGAAGADYDLSYDRTTNSIGLFKWDGSSSYTFVDSKSLTGSFTADTQYFVIAAADMGITDGFNFNVAAGVGADPGASSQVDYVPESGTDFHYSIQSKFAIKLVVSDYGYDTPHAGKLFRTAIQVKRSDTQALLTGGATVTCSLVVGGKHVPGGHAFSKLAIGSAKAQSSAVCGWRIPKSVVGKTLTATETVTFGSSHVTRTVRLRVRK
jgi:hypothetical protein